ncbi:HAD family hydrolase [Kitasatospora sp. NPDC059088]|uniref:HAD family hydrolase n=1 Tax=Kitasatospora sp. NPDC059088 TaxID=3346722 RepID=UPI0036827007
MTTDITAVLCDMNGLFRHWRNTGARRAEQLAGLAPGTIAHYAYDHPAYRLARVGVLTDQQWADDVAERLGTDHGPRARQALAAWRADRGEGDPQMIALLGKLRRRAPVGVLSNCTDALHADLKQHGIEFDFVFASADLGVDKPSPLAYRLAAERMGVAPQQLAYFDDEPTFVTAAAAAGLHATRFRGAEHFAAHLASLGLPVA